MAAALGDVLYRGSSLWKRLVGNTTTTRKMLCQTGTGAASAAPVWTDLIIERATVTLTNAQIKALPTTPVTLIAAPGAGKLVEFVEARVYLKIVADYTNIDANDPWMVIGCGGDDVSDYLINTTTPAYPRARTELTRLLTGAGLYNRAIFRPWKNEFTELDGWGALAYAEHGIGGRLNASLALHVGNAGGDFTGGDAGNAMLVITDYHVVTVP